MIGRAYHESIKGNKDLEKIDDALGYKGGFTFLPNIDELFFGWYKTTFNDRIDVMISDSFHDVGISDKIAVRVSRVFVGSKKRITIANVKIPKQHLATWIETNYKYW